MKRAQKRAVLGVLLCPLFFLVSVHSQSWRIVQRIIDGDTIVLDGGEVIRLIGIDAPEWLDTKKPIEPFAVEATQFVRRISENKKVRLEYEGERTDVYGRTLAYMYLEDGTFLNAEIVKQGFARAYTKYPFKYMDAFLAYEQEAKGSSKGLWAASAAAAAVSLPAVAAPATNKAEVNFQDDPEKTIVYVTRTGTKYHRAGCSSLRRSALPMSLKEASARYGPCSICRPPTLSAPSPAVSTLPRVTTPPAAASGRCQAITKKGTQCTRRAEPGSIYCWQHKK